MIDPATMLFVAQAFADEAPVGRAESLDVMLREALQKQSVTATWRVGSAQIATVRAFVIDGALRWHVTIGTTSKTPAEALDAFKSSRDNIIAMGGSEELCTLQRVRIEIAIFALALEQRFAPP